MSKRPLLIPLVALLCALGLTLALPATAKAPACTQCDDVTLKIGKRLKVWTSRHAFADDAPVEVTLSVRGRELDAESVRQCVARFYGQGVIARVSACKKPRSRIRVRAISIERRPVKLRVAYRAP